MPGNQQLFQEAMKQGHSAAWDQQWDKAAAFYKKALEEFPDDSGALSSLGLALFEKQNYKEALRYYQRASELNPDDPVPLEKVAELCEQLGMINQASESFLQAAELYARSRDMDKAIETWSRVTRMNPEHLMAHSRLALVYERMGRKQQALMEFLATAALLQRAGEVQKAVQTVLHAIQLLPDSPEANQALSLLKSGQPLPRPVRPRGTTGPLFAAQARQIEATKEAERADSTLDPITEARQQSLTYLAGLLFDQSDEDQDAQAARKGMQRIVQGAPQPDARPVDTGKILLHVAQIVDLQSRGEDRRTIQELEGALEAGLDHAAAYFLMGLLLNQAGEMDNAINFLRRAVKHTSFGMAARLLLGQSFRQSGKAYEAAIEYLEALKMADASIVPPEKSEELVQLYEPVIEAQAQQTDEFHNRLCDNIHEILMKPNWREQLQRARQQLPSTEEGGPPVPLAEILTEAHGGRIVESISKIHQLARMGMHRAAMEEAFYALQQAPTYLPLHSYIADLLIQMNNPQGAAHKYAVIANTYSSRGEARRAVDMYRKIIELSPLDMEVRSKLIDQLVQLGMTESAIAEYMSMADGFYNLADLISARKTFTEALRLAQQSNVDKAWKVKILHSMADIDMQSLDWRQAVRVFEQIRTLQPSDEKARSSLIELNIRLGQGNQAITELDSYISFLMNAQKRDDALKYLETLVSEYPKQPAIRRRLAELYRQAGRVPDAINQLDTAGDMLIQAGDRAGAAEMVMAILALDPPNAADYQRVLQKLQAH